MRAPTKINARRTILAAVLAGAALLAAGAPVSAQDFPSRPITVIVPFAAGGSSDVVMRLASKKAAEILKQTIVIDNRPGGGGNVAAVAIKNAPADGYLLMMGHTGTHAINATLYQNLGFDPAKDFTPISPLISFNNLLLVLNANPAKSPQELVALAKSKPDGLTYGSQGVGTGGHLLGVLLSKQTGINLVHIPYRGVAPAITDLVGGRLDMMFASYITAKPHIDNGNLRMLAIAGGKRHPEIPQVPTMEEAGFPSVQMEQWFGLFGPAGVPEPVVRKLNEAFTAALESDEIKNALRPQGAVIIPGPPQGLAAMVKRDVARLGQVVKDSGVAPQ